jgi:hypothetical protein
LKIGSETVEREKGWKHSKKVYANRTDKHAMAYMWLD